MSAEKYALFIDIDCTLTADNHIIPDRNILALKKARADGHKIFINTGRSYGNIPPEIFRQIEVDGVISGNGTAIRLNGKFITDDFLDDDVYREIARFCFEKEECWAVFEGYKRSYTIGLRSRPATSIEKAVLTFDELMKASSDDKIQVIAVSKNVIDELLKNELISDKITTFRFDRYNDIVKKGKNKAEAMLRLLDIIGIPRQCSMAFGDSENDKNMLIEAGIGVAVANSQPELLEIADYVTLSNKDGGVGAAIEKFLLKGETENG